MFFSGKRDKDRQPGCVKTILKFFGQGPLGGHTRPSSTELRCVVSLLRFWLAGHADSLAKRSVEAACGVVHGIQDAKFFASFERTHAELKDRAVTLTGLHERYIDASNAASGEDTDCGVAKRHWLGHVPTQLVRDHGIFDSYTVERLHKRVKKHAKPLSNTRGFERTILERVTADHCFDATVSDGAALGTVGPAREATARALRGAPANAASDFCSYHGKQQCSTDDFIKAFGSVGKIIHFVTIGADNAVCVIVRKCVEVNNA